MKDLNKNYIYDLSDLNKEERAELFEYLLSVDRSYSSSEKQFKKTAKDLIYLDNYNQWFWCDWDYAPDSFNKQIKNERVVINAKTLFAPKVNIINPTESDNIQEWRDYFKAQKEAIKSALGVNINDLIDSLNYMKEQFNSKQCTSREQDLKCNIDFVESENFLNSDSIQETKDSMLESIIQFRINIIEDNKSQLEKELFNNENLNDFTKTELMKKVIGYSKQKDVLESILKDYDLRKLTLQCEK